MRLDTLPNEILRTTRLYVLPKLDDQRRTHDKNAANNVFTHPILQVCSHLKGTALKILKTNYVWIKVRAPRRIFSNTFHFQRGMPLVKSEFLPYIDAHARWVHLDFECASTDSFSDANVGKDVISAAFPFSFDNLSRFLSFVGGGGMQTWSMSRFDVWYENMNKHLRKVVRLLTPIWSTIARYRELQMFRSRKFLSLSLPYERHDVMPLQSPQWHCQHAIEIEIAYRMSQMHGPACHRTYHWVPPWGRISLENALMHSYMARAMNPSSEMVQQLCGRYEEILDDETKYTAACTANARCARRILDGVRSDGSEERVS